MTSSDQPFLPLAEPDLGPLEEQYLLDALRSGWISSIGAYVKRFEDSFASLCGVDHAVAVSNGTVALHLALGAAGVGPGDEVIIPALTFAATAAAVRHAGAEPVFVDSEPAIGTMDPAAVAKAVSPRTKAVIPVHLYGHPADMGPIMEVARTRGLVVIEDAAEAHGARCRGRVVGGIGHMAAFSFYGNKILTTGEGGIVTTGDAGLARRLHFLKDHAMDPERRYWHPEVGFNYRITNLQAAVGCAQVERYPELIARRQQVVEHYRAAFAGTGVEINPRRSWAEPAPWLACALLPPGTSRDDRDTLMADLKGERIDSRPYFYLISEMPPYVGFRRVGVDGAELGVASDLSQRGLNLPTLAALGQAEAKRVASCVRRSLRSERGRAGAR